MVVNFFSNNVVGKEYGIEYLPWWVIFLIALGILLLAMILPWNHWKHKRQAKQETKVLDAPKESTKLVKVLEKPGSCSICKKFENKILDLNGISKEHESLVEARKHGFKHKGCLHEFEPWEK